MMRKLISIDCASALLLCATACSDKTKTVVTDASVAESVKSKSAPISRTLMTASMRKTATPTSRSTLFFCRTKSRREICAPVLSVRSVIDGFHYPFISAGFIYRIDSAEQTDDLFSLHVYATVALTFEMNAEPASYHTGAEGINYDMVVRVTEAGAEIISNTYDKGSLTGMK